MTAVFGLEPSGALKASQQIARACDWSFHNQAYRGILLHGRPAREHGQDGRGTG